MHNCINAGATVEMILISRCILRLWDALKRLFSLHEARKDIIMSLATLVLASALQPGGIIAWIVIGIVAGWLAGVIMPGRGFGLIGDLIVGLIGAFVGGLVMDVLAPNDTFGFWGSLLVALIGACILVAILHAFTRNRTTVA
jgi:uncharacterized membrane protein YeaQ/YmgE (transglycosylase-associated protein family)